ncbi:unnamed protein product [Staurois parvus]|uniref:Uncharacterized protein n=1 Tax=Staurois parvus TaxID=386267 RepID=A0ABN9E385_9NEOB|nr:unnamed protein product [Staurois parvus]
MGWAVNGGSTSAAKFVDCQSGFASTSGRILGALRACVRILGGCETILVLATTPACTALMGLATSPSHTAVLVLLYRIYIAPTVCSQVQYKKVRRA